MYKSGYWASGFFLLLHAPPHWELSDSAQWGGVGLKASLRKYKLLRNIVRDMFPLSVFNLTLFFRRQCTLQAPKLEPIPGGSASAQLITSDYASVSYSASPYSNEDLRAAVYEYFSASNRIAMGERYRIRGRRVLTNGQVEWLIEWKSCIT